MDEDAAALAGLIDHTVLGPTTTTADVETCVDEASEYGMNACVPPWAVDLAVERAPETPVCTVVGFPHGQHHPEVKRAEAERAWADGADELDVVLNVGRLKAGEAPAVRDELEEVVAAVPIPVKVIVEAPLLTDAEKRRASALAREAGAAFLKTATGFAEGGATVEDVRLLGKFLPVKASGGIGSWAAAEAMLTAGAERIGASAGTTIVDEFVERTAPETEWRRADRPRDSATDGQG